MDIKQLFALKWEFTKKGVYSFSFDNDKELKFFIENIGIQLPEQFITALFDATCDSKTGKLNVVYLKQFIDVCQDTVQQEEKTSSKTMR